MILMGCYLIRLVNDGLVLLSWLVVWLGWLLLFTCVDVNLFVLVLLRLHSRFDWFGYYGVCLCWFTFVCLFVLKFAFVITSVWICLLLMLVFAICWFCCLRMTLFLLGLFVGCCSLLAVTFDALISLLVELFWFKADLVFSCAYYVVNGVVLYILVFCFCFCCVLVVIVFGVYVYDALFVGYGLKVFSFMLECVVCGLLLFCFDCRFECLVLSILWWCFWWVCCLGSLVICFVLLFSVLFVYYLGVIA